MVFVMRWDDESGWGKNKRSSAIAAPRAMVAAPSALCHQFRRRRVVGGFSSSVCAKTTRTVRSLNV